MFLRSVLVTAALVAAMSGNISAATCPSLCTCTTDYTAVCSGIGVRQPPPGYFPDITELKLNNNFIKEIGLHDLSGFPNLHSLYIQNNPITELDMNVFANHKKMLNLWISKNNITKITPIDEGVEMTSLGTLYMGDNAIKHIPSTFLKSFPRLHYFNVENNPIVFPGDGPFLSSKTLEYLILTSVDATSISSKTFSELPKVFYLYMASANFSEVGDAFSSLPSLNEFILNKSNLKALRRGAFSKEQKIKTLQLSDSEIEDIETQAVDGVVVETLFFSNTPLACSCKYESLYWWSIARNVTIYATCSNGSACQFKRRKPLV